MRNVVGTNEGNDVAIGSVIGGRKRIEGPADKEIAIEEEAQDDKSRQDITKQSEPTRLALVSTIQFAAALNRLKEDLSVPLVEDITNSVQVVPSEGGESSTLPMTRQIDHPNLDTGKYEITVPRSKPLSPGEILGCTAPRLKDVDAIL